MSSLGEEIKNISEREYMEISRRMDCIFNIRNNLLTFSFTAVLAILGVAYTGNTDNVPAVFLLPYFLIIPFTARIVYYRNEEARLSVLLEKYQGRKILTKYNAKVKEDIGKVYPIIAVLVNYEMFALSLACLMLCICKYPKTIREFRLGDLLYFMAATICTGLVFIIITSSFRFGKIKEEFEDRVEEATEES